MPKPRQPLVYGGRVTLEGDMQIATLHIDSPLLYRAALKHLHGRVTVTIAPEQSSRRDCANRYYWGVVLKMMAAESGHTADDLHEIGKFRHNSKVVADLNGEEMRIGQSTAKLTIAEFSAYLESVMLDGAEWLGLSFPEPRKTEDWRCCALVLLFLFGMFNLGWDTGAKQCVNHPQDSYCQGLKGK